MKNTVLLVLLCMMVHTGIAQSHSNRLSLNTGYLYERGVDLTLSVEHETLYHNAWEFFANIYAKYDKDPISGKVTRESFFHNYRTWGFGIAYKPCVYRAKNSNGSLRLGASAGSDTHDFVGWVHAGYEYSYALRHGCFLFWQIKSDLCIGGEDWFRTGVELGYKITL